MNWLFIDFDGTLRNGINGTIDLQDLNFIQNWILNKNKFIITTGRPYHVIKNYLLDNYNLEPDFFITNSGSLITNSQQEVLNVNLIDRVIVKKIIQFINENKNQIDAINFADTTGEYFLYFNNWSQKEKEGFLGLKVLNFDIKYLLTRELICLKLLTNKKTWQKFKNFCEINNLKVHLTNNHVQEKDFNEIHPLNTNKYQAVKFIQNLFKIPEQNIYTAGDDNNDKEMLLGYKNSFLVLQEYNNHLKSITTNHVFKISEIKIK